METKLVFIYIVNIHMSAMFNHQFNILVNIDILTSNVQDAMSALVTRITQSIKLTNKGPRFELPSGCSYSYQCNILIVTDKMYVYSTPFVSPHQTLKYILIY